MNILKSAIFGSVLILVSANLYADESKDLLAIEYLKLSKTKETFDMTIDAYVEQFASQGSDADKESLRSFFKAYMGWETLKEPTIKLVAETLTAKELKDINDFYKTDSGRALAKKSPKMASDISNLIGANLQKAIQKMQGSK
ncbi:DUF2059 domain-containing protein [Marinospirillum sp.]|uniref:DUF2059 domain-containing protein n=1 Tax=Marinospirillum sp. TaxID=2183934 RepID=UPI00384D3566